LKTKARLEAEIIMLRHQLNVLRQRVPSKPTAVCLALSLVSVGVERTPRIPPTSQAYGGASHRLERDSASADKGRDGTDALQPYLINSIAPEGSAEFQ
jgi:hypothetical protein